MELKKLHTEDTEVAIGFAESRIGGRQENQDSYGAANTKRGFLVTVCDGMGGGPGGKTASTIAVKEIVAGVDESSDDETIPNVIIKAVRRANMAILEEGNKTPSLRGMGSTATVLLITEQSAFVAHVGDSRVYQLRGKKKVFRTFDHSQVFELVKQGIITEEVARLAANSNIITRALGIAPDVEVDIQELPYEKGDRFLLCSDGIHGMMPEKNLIKMVTNKKVSLGVVVDDVATFVDDEGRTNGGGHDNLTIALLELKTNSKLKVKMSKLTKIILWVLAAICAVSLCLNIVLLTGSKPDPQLILKDSVAVWNKKDSVYKSDIKNLNDSIAKLNEKISKVEKAIK